MNIKPIFRILMLSSFVMLIASAPLFGQRPMDIEEIRVVAPYQPTVSDAFKINDNPRIDDTLQVKPSFTYAIRPRGLNTQFELEPLTAARMRGEPLTKLYQGHIKGGFGNYTTPYVEAFYNTLRSNTYALGLHLKHRSSKGGIKDYGYNGYSDNLAHIYGKRFFGTNVLNGGIRFDRNMIHYYGYKPDDYLDTPIEQTLEDMTSKDFRQRINQLNASVGFGSNFPDSARISYHSGLEYNWLTDRYDAMEHNIRFRGGIGREMEDPFALLDQLYLGLDFGTDFYRNRMPVDTISNALISIFPKIMVKYDILKLFAGVNINVQADTASYFRVYPNIGLEAALIDRHLILHSEFSGGMKRQSLRELLRENPFMTSNVPLAFQNNKMKISAGIKGAFTDQFSYNLGLFSSRIDNYPFFVTDTTSLLHNEFTLAYDNLHQLQVRGELFGQFGSRFQVRLSASYFQNNPEVELEAWHLPNLILGLNMKYNMQDKIILSADLSSRDAAYGRIFNELGKPEAYQLYDWHIDANLGLEYRYSRILSFFLNFQNLANQSLERWLNYPSQKFHIMGGATWSF
ncbi:MAG: hypothetical protein RBS53_04310 [Bacteroidales bacterium]|nr:hypothetical protein [Bacteroidales bacterium]NLM91470.1 hypothetical protein [Bacteroidales bacterium]